MGRKRIVRSVEAGTPRNEAPVPNQEREVVIDRLTELVERQSQQIQQLLQQRDVGQQQGAIRVQPQQRAEYIDTVGERFRKLNPPIFEDALDPTVVEDWLRTLENMFRYGRVSEEEKVVCASFMLRGSAGHWWETIRSIEDTNTMSWDRFKELFRNKYFTAPVRAMKLNEFIQLRQGNSTVGDYIRKFEELSRFATHMINTDALKVERFLEGLRPELYRDVTMAGILGVSFSQIAERALVAEQAELKIFRAQEARRQFRQGQGSRGDGNERKRTFQGQNLKEKFHPKQGPQQWDQNKRLRIDPNKIPQSSCPKCGRFHTGACATDTRTCYTCGKVGHIARACPNNQNYAGQKKVSARVFAITRTEAEANPSLVTGKLSISGIPALVLFDPGATHSFVSTEYVRRLGRVPEVVKISYNVTVPCKDPLQTNQILRACAILIESHELYVDLIVLAMKDYDIILGMDWLAHSVCVNVFYSGSSFDCRKNSH